MKRAFGTLRLRLPAFLLAVGLFILLPVLKASAYSSSLTGPSVLRPGDSFSVTLYINEAYSGYSGSFKYDKSLLSLKEMRETNGFVFKNNGDNAVGYKNEGGTVKGSALKATFIVNPAAKAGTRISVGFSGEAGDADGNESALSASYSVSLSPSLPSDNYLSSLKVGNAKLSPAFSPSKTRYDCGTVPFDVERLNISAVARDRGASVSVSGARLSVGENTLTVTVAAANGARRSYFISVKREQDPSYVPSGNASLASLSLSSGQLSPAFASNVFEYVVYVPFETESISASGTSASPLAKGVKNEEDKKLKLGKNRLCVECTAEDGTKAKYIINVIRMQKFDGSLSSSIGLKDVEGLEPCGKEAKRAAREAEKKAKAERAARREKTAVAAATHISCALAGAAVGTAFMRRRLRP